jgi:acetyl esterase/lipase
VLTQIVPWLFLGAASVGAWFTLNAYRPFHRPAVLAALSFFAGWLTTELALHHLIWQAAATAGFVVFGGLAAWPGFVALGMTVVSWFFLLRCQRKAREAERVMDAALKDGLGATYAADIPEELAGPLAPTIDWRSLLVPIPVRHPEVERTRDVVYTEGAGYRVKLDVYKRRGNKARAPVLLQVHGGAWVLGSKDEQGLPLVLHLASRGWVCVSADYRLAPKATFPDPLIDLKHALRWIREHAEELGADPDFIVVTGGSAGGHLASLVALTANQPEYQPGFEAVDTSVRGCVAFYGVYDFTDRHGVWQHKGLTRLLERRVFKKSLAEGHAEFDKASPLSRVHEQAPPFLVIHGDSDTMVPVGEARNFVKELRERTRAPVAYAEIPGAQHAFEIFPSLRTAFVIHGVERFLAWLWARYRDANVPVSGEQPTTTARQSAPQSDAAPALRRELG